MYISECGYKMSQQSLFPSIQYSVFCGGGGGGGWRGEGGGGG